MRAKTLILTAVLGAASVAAVMAADPVYSVNIVGYVNVTVKPGFQMIANPLSQGDNKLGTIIPTAPDFTLIYKWAGETYNDAETFLGGAWIPGEATLIPGEGAFVFNPNETDITLTFVGEVATGALSTPVPVGFSIKSSQVPQSVDLSTIGFPAQDFDLIYQWDTANQTFFDPLTFLDGAWIPNSLTPAVGESFFVFNANAEKPWTRTFNVN